MVERRNFMFVFSLSIIDRSGEECTANPTFRFAWAYFFDSRNAQTNLSLREKLIRSIIKEFSHRSHIVLVAFQSSCTLLLESAVDVDTQGGMHGIALQAASEGGYHETVRLLLEHGADVNLPREYYGSALRATTSNEGKINVQLSLEHGGID
ncbi:hypothetical protein FIBSPDRAFT_1055054 [Athelia psychrophila]|uniref:Uncharacterized protein n=1 Tax=Athelia psychrophila TaxID=1759441 RepID=A0A167UDK6_9AGAM|nr:hypothetical protein FIBSPDRAFT_1055054 [Fibularhizoctonia sp. CBS 109695]